MIFIETGKKGLTMVLVLGVVIIIMVLSGVMLSLIQSQSTQTQHQVRRIQAYYASFAGVNLALERLRTGDWNIGTYRICPAGCSAPDINDGSIGFTVVMDISDAGGVTKKIKASTLY